MNHINPPQNGPRLPTILECPYCIRDRNKGYVLAGIVATFAGFAVGHIAELVSADSEEGKSFASKTAILGGIGAVIVTQSTKILTERFIIPLINQTCIRHIPLRHRDQNEAAPNVFNNPAFEDSSDDEQFF